ncbi:precorrin-6A/cobalt-precorrin-6A reductase [Thetidibacter halocola]|uniref:Precorrin-6A/cobalt-precorrin-6A reductase n=1 Tax=Thetidibacter halocola TaxID=2827239 RepID=A0A8J7WAG5_9RHOB|nr:precorrin-6A/cobalt-precorrin-6A reductase [Thetidibacter halocola]MBS0123937.1 precorrin-6A/cobalt-precorrin-6A reductase [Thetidibacter halocola]
MNGIVIIAGSAEAHALARALPGAHVHMPVPERVARRWSGPVSTGPVDEALLALLGARVVVEAAHPCDSATAFAVARACEALGLPRLQLVRPGWRPGPRDRWTRLRRVEDAARVIPSGARVLVTLGRAELPRLRGLRACVLARRIGRGGRFPLRHGRFLPGEGPFTPAQEARLLRRERIDWLIVPDAGGPGGWPKLAAARALGLPVALIDRPRRPDGPSVATVKEALAWLTCPNG